MHTYIKPIYIYTYIYMFIYRYKAARRGTGQEQDLETHVLEQRRDVGDRSSVGDARSRRARRPDAQPRSAHKQAAWERQVVAGTQPIAAACIYM
jgi:hypothetical protein